MLLLPGRKGSSRSQHKVRLQEISGLCQKKERRRMRRLCRNTRRLGGVLLVLPEDVWRHMCPSTPA